MKEARIVRRFPPSSRHESTETTDADCPMTAGASTSMSHLTIATEELDIAPMPRLAISVITQPTTDPVEWSNAAPPPPPDIVHPSIETSVVFCSEIELLVNSLSTMRTPEHGRRRQNTPNRNCSTNTRMGKHPIRYLEPPHIYLEPSTIDNVAIAECIAPPSII